MNTSKLINSLGLLVGLMAPLAAQTEPLTPVPALESSINLQATFTTTGKEQVSGPSGSASYSAKVDSTKFNTNDLVKLIDDTYDLVTNPKDYSLVAVLVDTETESGYRFYLKSTKNNGTTDYVYLAPEVFGITIDASAMKYREQEKNGELSSGSGSFKHAVSLTSAGIHTQGIATGTYTVRDVTVGTVTTKLSIPSAMKVETTGYYVENPDTEDAVSHIAELRLTFTAGKAVDLNDYPAPPAPEPETP